MMYTKLAIFLAVVALASGASLDREPRNAKGGKGSAKMSKSGVAMVRVPASSSLVAIAPTASACN